MTKRNHDWVYRHKICGRCGRTKGQVRGVVCDGRMLNPYAEPSEHSWSYPDNQAVKEVTHDEAGFFRRRL